MKYVLDSSVAFKWEVVETDSDKAIRLRDNFRSVFDELLSPDFFPVELGHALTRAERQSRIAIGQSSLFWADAMTTCPNLISTVTLTARAIEISSQLRIGVYDCVYVALAEREGCQFITADDKLVNKLQASFPLIVALSSLP